MIMEFALAAVKSSSHHTSLSGWWILAIIALIAGIRLWAGAMDRDRIRGALEEKGCTALNVAWRFVLFSGERNERHYDVTYRTKDGRTMTGFCKTSLWTGVWWKENAPS